MAKRTHMVDIFRAGKAGYEEGQKIKAGRTEAKLKQAKMQAELDKIGHEQETGSIQQQIDTLNAKNKESQIQNTRHATYRALDSYSADGDVRHLNDVSRNDPMLKVRTKGLARIAKIDWANDMALVKSSGRVPEGAYEADPKTAAHRFVKLVKSDGTEEIMDMENVYRGTGYARYLDKNKQLELIRQNKIKKASGKGQQPTAMVRNATAVAEAQQRIDIAKSEGKEPSLKDKEIVKFGATKKAGVTAGKLDAADQATEDLVKGFGGREKFFKTNFDRATPDGNENYLDAYSKVAKIEAMENVHLTSKQKTQLNDIRTLISMGNPAKGLTEEETGILDSTVHSAKKYINNEVGGTAATSAYAAFRNTVRHALYGSALTPAEIESFKQAFGTLGQKLGPVLQQFKTSLTQVKAQLESISSMQNPYSAHVRLGVDAERMDRMLAAIDDRIEALTEFEVDSTKTPKLKSNFGGKKAE